MIHGRVRFTFALGIAITNVVIALAQEPSATTDPKSTANTAQVLDQLVEQNQRLEKQNQQIVDQNQQLEKQNQDLMEQVKALRGAAPATSTPSESSATPAPAQTTVTKPANPSDSANPASAQTASGAKVVQTGQSSGGGQNNDDKTKLPEASEGNPAIFGEFNPGRGFTVAQGEYGKLNLSGYMAARYLNQLPGSQLGKDHLGRPLQISPRQDFQFHRVMLFSQGWLFSPKFQYSTFVWTVQDTNQVAVGGALYYNFGKYLTLGAGWNGYPGTLSLQGSHPYWLSFDRVMADEYFRPFFSQGVFGAGEILPRLQLRWMIGNNNSNLDVAATKLDRNLSGGFALTWEPTTGEFGPRGAFGDYEQHDKLATRFNLAYTYSPEDRQSEIGTPAGNTTLRLADSLNIFDTGALANGVTIEETRYQLVSAAAGMKYRGVFIQGEGYGRKLDDFKANGILPVKTVRDFGFYVQASAMVIPKRFELYGATSYIFSDYGHPKEFIVGTNYYPWNTRNIRLNTQLINVNHSPVSSTFGFYLGQLNGQIVTVGVTALY